MSASGAPLPRPGRPTSCARRWSARSRSARPVIRWTSPARCSSWRPATPATSRARCSRWMAGPTPAGSRCRRTRAEGSPVTADSQAPAVESGQDPDAPIIETIDVSKHFPAGHSGLGPGRPTPKAVDGVSLTIRRGETLALVGETGSGKTTFGRLLLGLYRPNSGDIRYRGESILDRHTATARTVRRQVQGVFQDPYSSLNPTMTIGQALTEVLKVHH